jgi:TonB family protein
MKYFTFSAALLAILLSGCGQKSVPSGSETSQATVADNNVYVIVEEMPEFPGGSSALLDFINKNMLYPQEAREKGEQGRVVVEFVVTQEGRIINPKIVRNVSESIDKEALRVISLMPHWKPGKQNGRPVNVRYNLPLTFSLN